MSRKALIIGIDHYATSPLRGCVSDAMAMTKVLSEKRKSGIGYDCKTLVSKDLKITKDKIKHHLNNLLSYPADFALFYFSGHGALDDRFGGFLVTQDYTANDLGISMEHVMRLANDSPVRQIVMLLDCCHSGDMANPSILPGNQALLREGIAIITASRDVQQAVEMNGHGLFTSIILDALRGGAADILGNVTIAAIYNHVNQLLGPWDQRPIIKAHLDKMVAIKQYDPFIAPEILDKITEYFPTKNHAIQLSPAYQRQHQPEDKEKEAIFQDLQKLRNVGIVIPISDLPQAQDHMYYAAIFSQTCELTPLGKFYWEMVKKNRI